MYHSRITASADNARVQLGQRVRQLRVQHALTQTDLAEAAGIGRATIARIEGGTVAPQLRTVRSIATTLSVEPSELTAGLEELWTHDLNAAAAAPRGTVNPPAAGAGLLRLPDAAP